VPVLPVPAAAVSAAPPPDPIRAARWFVQHGYRVFPVWGVTGFGTCLCPKGKDCDNPGKHPATPNGFKNATGDHKKVEVFLNNPGTTNYGLVAPEGVGIFDVDGIEDIKKWDLLQQELGPLPATLTTVTGKGFHYQFDFDGGPIPSHFRGLLIRQGEKGYVVGPGSRHANGVFYDLLDRSQRDIAKLPQRWLDAIARETKTKATPKTSGTPVDSIHVHEKKQPEDIAEGGRHDYLRDSARFLRGRLEGEALFEAVMAINRRFPSPKTEEEVRRAIGDVETKFGPDEQEQPVEVPATGLFVNVVDYRAAQPTNVEWVSPLAAYGFVSLISGPPKAGKSTVVSNLLQARESNTPFLWGDPVPEGPSVLVTEEGGLAVVRKTQGLTKLDILDRKTFIVAKLSKLAHMLEAVEVWCVQRPPALVVIDTLAIWGDIKDENDAAATTKAIAAISVMAQMTDAAVVLVHHSRKGGGEHGESIRGSGAIFAAVDQSIELGFTNERQSDDRSLAITGRLTFGEVKTLAFDRPTMTYTITTRVPIEKYPTDQFPVDGGGQPGWTNVEAGGVWGMSPNSANRRLKELADAGTLVSRREQAPGSRALHLVYWRARPLLNLAGPPSVGERMADIFKED
jgi:AAA domain/Bifunctional DNA primase/polymerase, N-terminal